MNDMKIPSNKKMLLDKATAEVEAVVEEHQSGLITNGERYNKVVDIWSAATEQIASEMLREMGTETIKSPEGKDLKVPSFNPIHMMADSGARGSDKQMRQLAGMRGLMAKPSGEIIETPITSNFREGLSVGQYFISTHGARKGLADTALKTANSGYLTRRLVDVAQDCIIIEEDCQTLDGIPVRALVEGGEIIDRLSDRILGRVALEDLYDGDGKLLVSANEEVTEEVARQIEMSGMDEVKIRSALTCESKRGGDRDHRGAVDRGARDPAYDADVPHRRHGLPVRRAELHPGEKPGKDQVPGPDCDEEPGWEERRHEPERLPDRPGREQPGAGEVSHHLRGFPAGEERGEGEGGGAAACRVGSLQHPDSHGSYGDHQVRGHHRRDHDARAARRGHRTVHAGDHRVEGPGRPSADLDQGRKEPHAQASRLLERCPVPPAHRVEHFRRGRAESGGRRHHCEDPAGDHENERHHRRSAPRGGALRGEETQGVRRHLRNRRGGAARPGLQRGAGE